MRTFAIIIALLVLLFPSCTENPADSIDFIVIPLDGEPYEYTVPADSDLYFSVTVPGDNGQGIGIAINNLSDVYNLGYRFDEMEDIGSIGEPNEIGTLGLKSSTILEPATFPGVIYYLKISNTEGGSITFTVQGMEYGNT